MMEHKRLGATESFSLLFFYIIGSLGANEMKGNLKMTGKEELQGVLSLVDMTKVDLPSYNISAKKYDAIAKTYTKIIFLTSVLELQLKVDPADEESMKRQEIAHRAIKRIAENPLFYHYDNAMQQEKELIQKATDDVFGNRFSTGDPYLRTMQNSTRKSLMLRNMKGMLDFLQQFCNSASETLIDFCMSDEGFEKQLKCFELARNEIQENQEVEVKEQTPAIPETQEKQCSDVERPIPWWKRIFTKKCSTI